MAKSTGPHDRRAEHVALFGIILQFLVAGLTWGLSLWAGGSHLLLVLMRCMLVGVPIWVILYVLLRQMRRVGVEALETQELQQSRESGSSQTIFEMDDEALLLEQNRLRWMVRWLLPGGTVLISLALVIGHLSSWGLSLGQAFDDEFLIATDPALRMPLMWCIVLMGFPCFLYARYALAVGRLPQWGLIRAGAVCMSGSALACVLVALALMSSGTMEWAEGGVTYVLGAALFLLGAEFATNFILDLYRPHSPGEVPRPAFDSRLLGMIGEPGGLAKSVADAMNYQFGFQVSSTWFYQLLQRWLFPITVVAFAIMLSLSSVVIVDADESVVVERFGRLVGDKMTPGIHIKWPYPIDVVYRVPVKRIAGLVIGEVPEDEDDDGHGHHDEDQAVLWTEQHDYVPELMLLVASAELGDEPGVGDRGNANASQAKGIRSVPVNLLMASVAIEYRVKDIHRYLHRYDAPEAVLEALAYRYLTDYAASIDLDTLMGPGRGTLNRELRIMLQNRLDELELGIEIVFVGMREAHPPARANVAKAFQSVVAAQTSMAAVVNRADGEARRILVETAGTEWQALELDKAIKERDALPSDSPQLRDAKLRVEELLMGSRTAGVTLISGKAAAAIARARGKATGKVSAAAAKAFTFHTQLAAMQAAPELYKHRRILDTYVGLDFIRKYLIFGDSSNVIIEYDDSKDAGLDQVLSEGVEAQRDKNSN